jgi:ATP-binding cassette subfamily B protein
MCSFYGKEITIVKLRELLGTDISGTAIRGITEALGKLGFESKAVRADPESFEKGFTLPAVARIVRKNGTAHYVVVYST